MSEGHERLVIEVADGSRPSAELPRSGRLVIGSSKERADYVIDVPGVASVHCAIGRTKTGGWALKDMGSPQGTLVNGERVESARVAAGDRITLGECELRVIDPVARAASASAPAQAAIASGPASGISSDAAAATPVKDELTSTSARALPLPSIAGYTIERLLGRGGMGEVYLALQASLDRRVALKVLSRKFEADREFVRRFQAEARAAAALNHPNVVTVFDVGLDRGTHYLSMEYMDRGNLEERVAKGGKLAWREALDIVRDAASGLVYAEARGIVHRDLKPANLMQNHVGATKIADLGLATHVETEEAASADKKVFGTPHFMSPEQARGEKVDSRSDLYSLGATAYRLLSGHTPFEGTNARDIVRAHLRDTPRPLTELAPEVPLELVEVVRRLMQKDPAQRFTSAAELVRELDRIRAQSSTSSPAARPTAPRRVAGVTALVLLGLVGVGAWWIVAHRKDGAQRADPTAPSPAVAQPAPLAPEPNPAPTPEEGVDATDETPAADDDKALQLFEANARVAFLEVANREMDAAQRRDELRALAVKYRGTTAAAEASDRAEALATQLVETTLRTEQRARLIEEVTTRLREAAQLDRRPPRPAESLTALASVGGQEVLADDADFAAAKRSIEHAIIQGAASFARDELQRAQAAIDRGEFEAVESTLTALLAVYELPQFPMGHAPPGVDELFELGRRTRERLKNLEYLRVGAQSKQLREDAQKIARGFGGPSGLERELASLDFAAARARVASLSTGVASTAARAFLKALAQDLDHGEAVLATLGREFSVGGWRRRSFTDPRDKRGGTRNAVGADGGGILYDGERGAVERIPWSAFGGNTKELSKLFLERCTRAYTADEENAIAGLVRITAVVEALGVVGKMLDPSRRANFTEANARELTECFVAAREWAKTGAAADAWTRERGAADVLGEALVKATAGAFSSAVASVERVLQEYEDTLFVRLLSDGAPTTAPETVDAPIEEPAPDAGAPSTPADKAEPPGDPHR